jgi:hypothetical protein
MSVEFYRDDKWQREMRDNILVPEFYERNYQGLYELLLHTDERAAKGCDTLIAGSVRIDEKIVRWPTNEDGSPRDRPYDAYALETMSCTVRGYERAGWMETNVVEQLLYCFSDREERSLDCHVIDFLKLQPWFWREVDRTNWPLWTSTQPNRTQCRIVGFDAVRQAANTKTFKLFRRSWFDEKGRFLHYCHCGKVGDFGVGVFLSQGKLGQHFCRAHAAAGGFVFPASAPSVAAVQLKLF